MMICAVAALGRRRYPETLVAGVVRMMMIRAVVALAAAGSTALHHGHGAMSALALPFDDQCCSFGLPLHFLDAESQCFRPPLEGQAPLAG